jgi:hypothetical protein
MKHRKNMWHWWMNSSRLWVRRIAALALPLLLALPVLGQSADFSADTRDLETTLHSLYDVISGEAGVVRDEARFRNLFWPGAHLMAIRPDSTGKRTVKVMTVDEFYTGMSSFVKTNSFFEQEIARKTEQWDGIAHVWSTYEIRKHREDPEPFARGINSIQLFWDGQRWWVTTIYWQPEFPEVTLPKAYLPKRKGKTK